MSFFDIPEISYNTNSNPDTNIHVGRREYKSRLCVYTTNINNI